MDERGEDPLGGRIDRHGQTEPDPGDRRVDADDPPGRIGQRAAGVARVERRVGLDDVLDEAARTTVTRGHRPAEGRDDAGGHGPGEAERVADGDDQLPDPQPGGVTERRRDRRAVDADDGQVGQRIATDDPELALRAIDEGGAALVGAGDDVGRGDEVAVGGEGDRRPGPAAAPAAHPSG